MISARIYTGLDIMCSYSRFGFFKWFGPSLVLEAEEATDMLPPAWATGEENRARSLGWTPGPEALPKNTTVLLSSSFG